MTAPVSECSAWAQVEDLPASVVGLHSDTEWCSYLGMATDVLWASTGRRWRGANLTGEAVLRAAPPRAGEGGWAYHRSWGHCACYIGTGILGPQWAAVPGHHEPTRIRLPQPDVTSILSVRIDGTLFAGWRLDGPWLARIDGQGWPECHDRTTVTYLYGRPPPVAGVAACVELAAELGKATANDAEQPCRLPQRLQSVTRQGISFAALDDFDFLDRGLTGLYLVDLFIKSVNPHNRTGTATVWSPDLPRARRTP